jgi:hypothetical protein
MKSISLEEDSSSGKSQVELMPLHCFNRLFRSIGVSDHIPSQKAFPASNNPTTPESESLHGAQEIVSRLQRWSWISATNHSLHTLDTNHSQEKSKQKASMRDNTVLFLWTKYRQLEHCSWWSLSYTFGKDDRLNRVYMRRFFVRIANLDMVALRDSSFIDATEVIFINFCLKLFFFKKYSCDDLCFPLG